MRIYQLEIKNFRGIQDSILNFISPLVCLVGLGDSTKSTILDAIEYVLSPNWFLPIDDSDFTNCNISEDKSIKITTTIGPIPEALKSESKYGLYLRGWNSKTNELHDEPREEDICVLSVRLTIDSSLTPEWTVITDRHLEGFHISYRDRQLIGISRIGNNIDNELAWTRGSSLLRLSKNKKEIEKVLLEANRQLRTLNITQAAFAKLVESIQKAKIGGKVYGINTDNLKPNVDPKNTRGNSSVISLHDGDVPFRRMGLGSRRLMSIGLQLECIKEGDILLIDEIEQALEPHRLKHLLRTLTKNMKEVNYGQVFMTTHSPVTLEELGADPLYCVHYSNIDRKTEIEKVGSDIQGTVRRTPEAFFSPKVIVCEGSTEIGLLRAFERKEIDRHDNVYSFAYNKVVIVDGEGTSASQRAYDLAKYRYKTCLFVDSDRLGEWKIKEGEIQKKGVEIIRWQNSNNTEMQLFFEIPQKYIRNIIQIVIDENNKDTQSILDSLNSDLSSHLETLEAIDNYADQELLRQIIAKSASKNTWFKNIAVAEKLGDYLFGEIFDSIKDTQFYQGFRSIQAWARDGK